MFFPFELVYWQLSHNSFDDTEHDKFKRVSICFIQYMNFQVFSRYFEDTDNILSD